ncbi:basic leucine zipper 25-like [Coffea eugenioides]|uniref:basic leucine zipper 25-like n=1 Tax=Coffea eugenioides TaxID=49369 RepID=UPI000F60877E|nr:basic leucine zipper 25-like [Coffea eugenioides]
MLSADGLFGNPFPAFESGFPPWDCQEPPFVFPQHDDPILSPLEELRVEAQEPVISNSGSESYTPPPLDPTGQAISISGSENYDPTPLDSSSGSEEPNQNNKRPYSGSDDTTNPPVDSAADERKRRRMLSNRESAKRSRMRKQKHLENLRNQVSRLRIGNRELVNRLRVVTHHCQLVRTDNDRLRSESVILRQRLWDIRQVLLVRQLQQQLATSAWPCNNLTPMNDETIPQPLIT